MRPKTPALLAALLLATPLALTGPVSASEAQSLLAQTSPQFSLPENVPGGTSVRISSSPSMAAISQALKSKFETAYEGSSVRLAAVSSDEAIASLVAGEVDLAAIGRPLSGQEKAQGLVEVPISREKIAVIVGADNLLAKDLTFEQFARIFRGDITDWSQVGRTAGPIRLIDRLGSSDTRWALSGYDVFKGNPFETGARATQIGEDDTAAVIQALSKNGISYAIANHVLDQPGIKIVPMHGTLPDNPRYPYSQPRGYVYRGEPAPAIAAFLGYVTSSQGQAAVTAARLQEAAAVTSALETSTPPATETPAAGATTLASDPTAATSPLAEATIGTTGGSSNSAQERGGLPAWLWWLLPLAALAALLWWLSRNRSSTAEAPAADPIPPTALDSEADLLAADPVPPTALDSEADLLAADPVPPSPPVAEPTAAAAPIAEAATPTTPAPEPPTAASPPAPSAPALSAPVPAPPADPNSLPPTPVTPPPTAATVPTVPTIPIASGAAGLAAGVAAAMAGNEDQSVVEASKFNVIGRPVDDIDLSDVDHGLAELPDGYGESRIVLLPRDPQWAYAYWDAPNEHKEALRRQGGQRLALRLYDVTDIDIHHQTPHNLQEYDCDELARDWYLPIPVSDRDYLVEIGYLTPDGRWLILARSNPIHIPPVYPSDWIDDQFLTVDWNEDLKGKTLFTLTQPGQPPLPGPFSIHDGIFALAQSTESLRVAGSLFGSMQHVPSSLVPQQAISSYVFPSGMGLWGLPTASGLPTLSGVGFSASAPPIRPRKFWLVADAELIVYGATEPDATVTVGGQPIKLNPDGSFRFQMSFQDGVIDYPIMAVATDGEQTRSIHMAFERETPERRTNTAAEAQDEWPAP